MKIENKLTKLRLDESEFWLGFSEMEINVGIQNVEMDGEKNEWKFPENQGKNSGKWRKTKEKIKERKRKSTKIKQLLLKNLYYLTVRSISEISYGKAL